MFYLSLYYHSMGSMVMLKEQFILNNISLYQHDIHRKPQGLIMLDDSCRISKAEGANTFEIATTNCNDNGGKHKANKSRSYYLTADSQPLMEDWVRILQNVIQRNALQLLLKNRGNNHDGSTNSTEEGSTNSTLEAWVTKVKHGHAKKVWYAKQIYQTYIQIENICAVIYLIT